MTRLGSILLWSAIAAAFVGPGTVTAAASAGPDSRSRPGNRVVVRRATCGLGSRPPAPQPDGPRLPGAA